LADADVLIVGAGPAGSAAAISCAEAGLQVLITDRETFPRDRPGETLHPGVEPLFGRLGVLEQVRAADYLRHEGVWVSWGSRHEFVPYGGDAAGPWRGFQAWGADLDGRLLARTRELGATVLQPVAAWAPLVLGGRVAGVHTDRGTRRARFVIDAGGGRHWLARCLSLPLNRRTPPLAVRFGYAAGACPARDAAPAIVADERGWTWTARVRPGLYQWTRLTFGRRAPESGGPPPQFAGLAPRGRRRGADVTWRVVRPAAGPGYFLAGDAAFVLDPASSHGVLKALMSGILAGHLISGVHRGLWPEEMAARQYCGWLEEWFERDVLRLRGLYAQLPVSPGRP
jgi:flavin-dependent dehydrogenase